MSNEYKDKLREEFHSIQDDITTINLGSMSTTLSKYLDAVVRVTEYVLKHDMPVIIVRNEHFEYRDFIEKAKEDGFERRRDLIDGFLNEHLLPMRAKLHEIGVNIGFWLR